jgi:hypothetical protein
MKWAPIRTESTRADVTERKRIKFFFIRTPQIFWHKISVSRHLRNYNENQFNFRVKGYKKVKVLPVVQVSNQNETQLRMRFRLRSAFKRKRRITFSSKATRDFESNIVMCIYLKLLLLSRIY